MMVLSIGLGLGWLHGLRPLFKLWLEEGWGGGR